MSLDRNFAGKLLPAVLLFAAVQRYGGADELLSAAVQNEPAPPQNEPAANAPGKLTLTVGKSLIIDSPINIKRLSVANDDLVQAVAVDPRQVLINGKAPGETSLIVWQDNGSRLLYDLTIRMSPQRLDAARQQLAREFPGDNINVTYENDTAFVRGTVKDVISADRVMSIASTLGKAINLLRVEVPPVETQILLKVRFANVDRSVSSDLGLNLASGAFNQTSSITTGQYSPIKVDGTNNTTTYSISDALNVFMFRPDINLAVTIKALEARNQLEMLAEPNVLAINGKQASFVAGGEFPFPMLQGGLGGVTIMFREFGVRLNFLPNVTPRGTIRLQVAPEVSSLDYSHSVTFEGFTIPALATRRVVTEVELEGGQSFVIGGLLDNRTTENLNKIPGLSNIPLFGKLFQSRSLSRSNTELLVIVTPEIVRPVPAGQPLPALNYPRSFLSPNTTTELRQPGVSQTGPVPVQPPSDSIPIEELVEKQKQGQAAPNPAMPQFQLVPVQTLPPPPSANPGLTPPPLAPSNSGGAGK
ncbi:MAG: type II and III secretion system protein [Terriglobia bacterium]|nr:MAG: type II and III secretion system protein [Terriglobia bacterium]